jgi:hypothetical protein
MASLRPARKICDVRIVIQLRSQVSMLGTPVMENSSDSRQVTNISCFGCMGSCGNVAVTPLVPPRSSGACLLPLAPIAAFMAELFAARLRYTSMSLPFHLGPAGSPDSFRSASPHSTSIPCWRGPRT